MIKLLVRLFGRLKILNLFNINISHTRDGNRVIVPVIRSLGKENLHLSEMWMCDVLVQLLKLKKGLFIDVGVNVAQTLIKLKLVSKDTHYVGFDPNPICIFYTNELIKANGFQNTRVVPTGISDTNEIVTLFFYSDGDADSSASIVKDFRPQHIYRQEYVACFGYEQLKPIIESEFISIVKIDVEGGELQVLKGIKPLLIDKRPFILIEILPVYSDQNLDRLERQQEIESMMKTLDYKVLRIVKEHGQYNAFKLMETIGISTKIEDSDYLLCPAEMIDHLPIVPA